MRYFLRSCVFNLRVLCHLHVFLRFPSVSHLCSLFPFVIQFALFAAIPLSILPACFIPNRQLPFVLGIRYALAYLHDDIWLPRSNPQSECFSAPRPARRTRPPTFCGRAFGGFAPLAASSLQAWSQRACTCRSHLKFLFRPAVAYAACNWRYRETSIFSCTLFFHSFCLYHSLSDVRFHPYYQFPTRVQFASILVRTSAS